MESTTSGAKNFFLQTGIMVALYISTISFLTFIFNLINTAFPSGANGYGYNYTDGYSSSMRFSISALIVFFPIFIWLSRIYRKNGGVGGMPAENKIRKWLLYLTLFLTGLAMAIDLVILINNFLSGSDITTSFILKVLAVFIVSAKIFYFYLKDIQGYWDANQEKAKIVAYAVSGVLALFVIGGFFYIGSPSNQRKVNSDAQRINDLSSIQYEVVNFYQQKGVLPQNLDELKDPISGNFIPNDPKTSATYDYSVKAPLTFELCATFETESGVSPQNNALSAPKSLYYKGQTDNWNHAIGKTCFERPIDPLRYPVYSKTNPSPASTN